MCAMTHSCIRVRHDSSIKKRDMQTMSTVNRESRMCELRAEYIYMSHELNTHARERDVQSTKKERRDSRTCESWVVLICMSHELYTCN